MKIQPILTKNKSSEFRYTSRMVEFDPNMNESKCLLTALADTKLLLWLLICGYVSCGTKLLWLCRWISPVLFSHLFMSTSIYYHNKLQCDHRQSIIFIVGRFGTILWPPPQSFALSAGMISATGMLPVESLLLLLPVPRIHIDLGITNVVYWSSRDLVIAASACCMSSCGCCLFVNIICLVHVELDVSMLLNSLLLHVEPLLSHARICLLSFITWLYSWFCFLTFNELNMLHVDLLCGFCVIAHYHLLYACISSSLSWAFSRSFVDCVVTEFCLALLTVCVASA